MQAFIHSFCQTQEMLGIVLDWLRTEGFPGMQDFQCRTWKIQKGWPP